MLFSLILLTTKLIALFIPFLSSKGLAPATIFFMPSFIIDSAKTTAVVVPSPAFSFVFMLASLIKLAPRFSNELASSISFAIVTPSFVISGVPYFLSKTTFLPFGPRVILTAFANFVTPLNSSLRAFSPYIIFFAIHFSLLII